MITPAGPDHAQIAAASGILDYFDAVYDHHFTEELGPANRNHALNQLFKASERALLTPLMEFFRSRTDIRIVGPVGMEDRAPTVSILPLRKSLDDVYARLTAQNLMLGKGHFYAVRPLMDMKLPIQPGVLRISFLHYTSLGDISQLVDGLKKALDS